MPSPVFFKLPEAQQCCTCCRSCCFLPPPIPAFCWVSAENIVKDLLKISFLINLKNLLILILFKK